ncbi:MAG: hypothetical protein GEV07_16420 [Streptosporangiales bacterium]|nr:hypothetical protein [Streptosporangiales bacterium]
MNEPTAVAAGPDGELYVVDGSNQRVRVIGETSITPGVVVHPLVLVAVLAAALVTGAVVLRIRRRKSHPVAP